MDTLISYTVDFHVKKITSDREEHYIIIKGSIHQHTAILNASASNNKAVRCEANDRTERMNRKTDNYSWTLQISFSTSNWTIQRNQQKEEYSSTINQQK